MNSGSAGSGKTPEQLLKGAPPAERERVIAAFHLLAAGDPASLPVQVALVTQTTLQGMEGARQGIEASVRTLTELLKGAERGAADNQREAGAVRGAAEAARRELQEGIRALKAAGGGGGGASRSAGLSVTLLLCAAFGAAGFGGGWVLRAERAKSEAEANRRWSADESATQTLNMLRSEITGLDRNLAEDRRERLEQRREAEAKTRRNGKN